MFILLVALLLGYIFARAGNVEGALFVIGIGAFLFIATLSGVVQ